MTIAEEYNGTQTRKLVGFHSCNTHNHTAQTFGKVYDAKDEMKVLVETKAVKELSKSANDIALEVLTDIKAAHTGHLFEAMTIEQMKSLVYSCRERSLRSISEFSDWAARLESFPIWLTQLKMSKGCSSNSI